MYTGIWFADALHLLNYMSVNDYKTAVACVCCEQKSVLLPYIYHMGVHSADFCEFLSRPGAATI